MGHTRARRGTPRPLPGNGTASCPDRRRPACLRGSPEWPRHVAMSAVGGGGVERSAGVRTRRVRNGAVRGVPTGSGAVADCRVRGRLRADTHHRRRSAREATAERRSGCVAVTCRRRGAEPERRCARKAARLPRQASFELWRGWRSGGGRSRRFWRSGRCMWCVQAPSGAVWCIHERGEERRGC